MLKISYSGSLNSYAPGKRKYRFIRSVADFLWTYKNRNIDSSTRSGYFLIQAVKLLNEKKLIRPGQLRISLWGDIHPGNVLQIGENKVGEYFNIGGYLPKEESLKKLSDSDLLFLPVEKSGKKNLRTLYIPGKLFEYLNTGRPILALCEPSDCRQIIETSGMGICIEPDNILMIADTLLDLILHKEKLGTFIPDTGYIQSLSFQNKTAELAAIFDRLLADKITV